MWITFGRTKCVEIEDEVFQGLLSFYPEEELITRPKLDEALKKNSISFGDLQAEAEVLFIPWQMFFLEETKLKEQLENIEKNRADRLVISHVAKRGGGTGSYPARLIDRFIRSQNFLLSNAIVPENTFNKSLMGLSVLDSVIKILKHFAIDMDIFRGKRTSLQSLEYLIERIGNKNINIARGTTSHGLMPSTDNHIRLYKNLSGFSLKDAYIPFIYLSTNEIVGEEVVGRQIYTLIYLLVLIGLDVHSLVVNAKSIVSVPGGDKNAYLANIVTSELLIPTVKLEKYRGAKITWSTVTEIAFKFKVTPRAALYRLKKDKFITKDEHDELLKANPFVLVKSRASSPYVDTSVKKLCGDIVFSNSNELVKIGVVSPVQAQIILFGKPDASKWRGYRARVDI